MKKVISRYKKRSYDFSIKVSGLILLFFVTSFTYGQDKPNILIFFGDDMNWMDSEPYGNPDVITPNIARLSKEGILFDNMFTSTAMCSPSRQQFLTGLYPVKSGAYPNHAIVYDSIKSIAHHFKELGYRVGLIGKKHFGPEESYPFEYFGGRHHDNGEGQDIDLEKIRSFVLSNKQPYLLIIAQNQPHTPWNRGNNKNYDAEKITVPEYLVDTKMTRNQLVKYYSEITYADSLLGQCLSYIDKSEETDNTLVIFTSEQGSGFPFAKWTCYDLGLKTAFIARWPGKIKAGVRNDALTQYVDVVPTLLEAVGADPKEFSSKIKSSSERSGFDGKSFLGALLSKNNDHRDFVYGIQTTRGIGRGSACYPIRSVRSNRFKYIWNLKHEDPFFNLVTANQKSLFYNWLEATEGDPNVHEWVLKYKFRPEEELYDLQNDPFEKNNLANDPEYAEIKNNLKMELILWMENQGDKGYETEMNALNRQQENFQWKPFGGSECTN